MKKPAQEKPRDINKLRTARASALYSLQELRDDYELMLLDSLEQKRELTHLSAGELVKLNRVETLLAYHNELIAALKINIALFDDRSIEIQKTSSRLASCEK